MGHLVIFSAMEAVFSISAYSRPSGSDLKVTTCPNEGKVQFWKLQSGLVLQQWDLYTSLGPRCNEWTCRQKHSDFSIKFNLLYYFRRKTNKMFLEFVTILNWYVFVCVRFVHFCQESAAEQAQKELQGNLVIGSHTPRVSYDPRRQGANRSGTHQMYTTHPLSHCAIF